MNCGPQQEQRALSTIEPSLQRAWVLRGLLGFWGTVAGPWVLLVSTSQGQHSPQLLALTVISTLIHVFKLGRGGPYFLQKESFFP